LRAAVYLDQCAALAQRDASLTPADLKAASDAYARQAAELFNEADKRVNGNGQLENQLAWGLVTNPKPELRVPARAVKLAKKAVELAPKAGYTWNTLGVAQYRAGDWQAAINALEKSMELRQGGDSGDWFFVAMDRWQLGEKVAAQKWYQAAALWLARHSPKNDEYKQFRAEAATLIGLSETEPAGAKDDLALAEILVDVHPRPSSYLFRGGALADSDQWARAADNFTKAIELGEKSDYPWYALALIRRTQDDKPAYQAACADMLMKFAHTSDAPTAHFVAWTCALGPDALADFTPAIALAEKAVKKDAKSAQFAVGLGAILYRAGRFDEARQKLEEADRLASSADPRLSTPAYTWFFLGMTQHRLGLAAEAKQWLDKARQETDKALKAHDSGTIKLLWNRRLTLTLLRSEAEKSLDFKQPPAPPAAAKPTKVAAPVEAKKP
jgi:tetratricopeptide (TPR) repeat protein